MGSIFSWIVCQIILNMWLPKPMRENVTCSNFIRYTPFYDVKCVVAWLRLCCYCTPPQIKPFYNNKLSSHERSIYTYYFTISFIYVSYKLIKVGAWCVALIKEQLMPRHHYLWIMITETDDTALIEKERVLVIVVLSKYNFYPHVGWQFFLRGVQLCILRFLNQYLQMSLFLHLISYLKITNLIKFWWIVS